MLDSGEARAMVDSRGARAMLDSGGGARAMLSIVLPMMETS